MLFLSKLSNDPTATENRIRLRMLLNSGALMTDGTGSMATTFSSRSRHRSPLIKPASTVNYDGHDEREGHGSVSIATRSTTIDGGRWTTTAATTTADGDDSDDGSTSGDEEER